MTAALVESTALDSAAIKAACMGNVSKVLTRGLMKVLAATPEDAARAAYLPGGPSVEGLESRIRQFQAEHGAAVKAKKPGVAAPGQNN